MNTLRLRFGNITEREGEGERERERENKKANKNSNSQIVREENRNLENALT